MHGAFQRFRVSKPPFRKTHQQQQQDYLAKSEITSRYAVPSACERCRRLKKKCTRTDEGACSLCITAGMICSLPKPTNDPQEREKLLHERISWLSEHVNRSRAPNVVPVEMVETGKDLAAGTPSQASLMHPESAVRHNPWVTGAHDVEITPKSKKSLSKEAALRLVDAYFRHVHRAYPFLDRGEVLQELEALFASRAQEAAFLEIQEFPTYLAVVMAVGRTTLQRAKEMDDTPVNIPEKEIMHECLCRNDLVSVKILMLLALHSLFQPDGLPPPVITGILARKVVAMGLTRDSGSLEGISQAAFEHRRRLFWSVFVLDRMVSVSYGLPVSINDEEVNVSLPSITIEEYASPDRYYHAMTLQVNRHVVSLRQLEGRILRDIHLASSKQLSRLDTMISTSPHDDFRRQIDDRYTQGCLLSSSAVHENDHIPFHNTITWHNVRYQNLMVLLYSPSKVNFQHSVERIDELQEAAHKYMQSSLVLQQQKHLPLNWITLCRFLIMGALFSHCYVWRVNPTKNTSSMPSLESVDSRASVLPQLSTPSSSLDERNPYLELAADVALCAKILNTFPDNWTAAKQAATVFEQLAQYVSTQPVHHFLSHQTVVPGGFKSPMSRRDSQLLEPVDPVLRTGADLYDGIQRPVNISSTEEQLLLLRTIRSQIKQLVIDTLGETSIYAYAVAEDDSTTGLMRATTGPDLFSYNTSHGVSTAEHLFQESDMSMNGPGSDASLWIDVMDDLGLGML